MNKSHSSLTSNARNNFVVKVYSIVGLQLTVTSLFIVLNMVSKAFAIIQRTNTFLFWFSFIGTIVTMLALCNYFFYLVLSHKHATTFPNNMILLGLFTLG